MIFDSLGVGSYNLDIKKGGFVSLFHNLKKIFYFPQLSDYTKPMHIG